MSRHTGENLARIMAAQGLSIDQVVQKCGLDGRTVRAVLKGQQRPHARTLYRLAQGLGVPMDELFLDPARLLYRHFDHQTNPMAEELLDAHPEQFVDWTETQFAELASRVGTGGALTREGALAAAKLINRKRELMARFSLLLETEEFDMMSVMVDLAYEKRVLKNGKAWESAAPRACRAGAPSRLG